MSDHLYVMYGEFDEEFGHALKRRLKGTMPSASTYGRPTTRRPSKPYCSKNIDDIITDIPDVALRPQSR